MKTILSLALGLTLFATQALASNANTYRNDVTGLEITKPEAWSFVQRNDDQENYGGDSPALAYVTINADVPQVMIAKHNGSYKGVSPSVRVMAKAYGKLADKDPIPMISLTSMLMSFSNRNMMTLEEPKMVTLGGEEAAHTKVTYFLDSHDEKGIQVNQDIWIVKRDDFYFLIGAGVKTREADTYQAELQQIIETIKLF